MNPYQELNIQTDCTTQQVKSAYRKLSKKYHPDVYKGNDEKFKRINLAYRVLSDEQKRKLYDEQGIIIDESPNHINNLIQERMIAIANGWIDNMIKGRKIGLQKFVIVELDKGIRAIHEANRSNETSLNLVKNIKKRLKSKSNNTIHNILDQRIITYVKAKRHNETELLIIDQLKNIINEYEYEEEELYESISFGTNTSSTADINRMFSRFTSF